MTGHLASQEDLSEAPEAPRRVSSKSAAARLRQMAEEDAAATGSDVKCSIRIGDGPEIPFDEAGEEKLKDHFRKTIQAARTEKPSTGGVAADQLRSIVQRLERLHDEKDGIASDIKDLYAEAKGNGYDVPTLKKILKLRAMDAAERDEAEHLLDTYLRAMGMQSSFNFEEEQ